MRTGGRDAAARQVPRWLSERVFAIEVVALITVVTLEPWLGQSPRGPLPRVRPTAKGSPASRHVVIGGADRPVTGSG